jgi:hypothetical protein
MPLVADPATFDAELNQIMHSIDVLYDLGVSGIDGSVIQNPFLKDAWNMAKGYLLHKKHGTGRTFVCEVEAEDWRRAGLEWMERRNGP